MNISADDVNLLRQNARSMVRELGLLNDAYCNIGVTLAERHLLIELSVNPYPTIGEIAERLLLDKSTASRLISRAVKKGYIECVTDENDKRRRFLQLTDKGTSVLHAFEPIAFAQTKDALRTLSHREMEIVYQGVALYAHGLKLSRLHKQMTIAPMTSRDRAGVAQLLAELGRKRAEMPKSLESYHIYLVLKVSGKICGGAGICPISASNTSGDCKLKDLYLVEEMRQLGLEKLLLDACVNEASGLGYSRCSLDTASEPLFSIELLLEHGFNKQDTRVLWKAC